MKNSMKLLTLIGAIGALTLSANATPTLTFNDGVDPAVTVTDNGVGDLNPIVGAVTWSGSLGNWLINVTTGVTKPALGSAANPEMDLSSVNASSLGGGTLTITFSESGFIPSGVANAAIGGTLSHGGTLSASAWVNASQVIVQNFANGGSADAPFAGSANGAFAVGAGYTLSEQVVLNHRSAGITSLDYHLSVPDGGLTAGLLGFALVAVEGLRRKLAR
jgi:protein with PEP-CTERM/exosortase system signal